MASGQAPYLIGIAGPSGAGKSALARALIGGLPGSAVILSMDSYYRDFADQPPDERPAVNFDHPDALDDGLLLAHLGRLAQGGAVDRPVYCFATHRRAAATARVDPADFVIVEGLLALHWADVRALFRTAVFVDLADEACLRRRLVRDTFSTLR